MNELLIKNFFDPKNWSKQKDYFLSNIGQKEKQWHTERSKRFTSSEICSVVGQNNFMTRKEYFDKKFCNKGSKLSKVSMDNINRGILLEPKVRNWYEKRFNVKVREVGLAVPIWDITIGSSSDGEVEETNGIIEIKCPTKMYKPIIDFKKKIDGGWVPPKYYHDHIWNSHYMQMITTMAIMKKDWCDYILYSGGDVFVYKVDFNKEYWDKLYSKIKGYENNDFIENLKEYLEQIVNVEQFENLKKQVLVFYFQNEKIKNLFDNFDKKKVENCKRNYFFSLDENEIKKIKSN